MRQRSLSPLLYATALAFPLFTIIIVARFAVNVPIWDEWAFPLLIAQIDASELTLPELAWLQRGEHRKVFPHLIIFALARWTDFNVVAHIWASLVLRLASLFLVWRLSVLTAPRPD